jgi:menaquinone-specific isochorismate synthase
VNNLSSRSLVVETIELADVPEILSLLPAAQPLLWWRKGAGMVGLGHTLAMEFTGPHRVTDAAVAWHDLVANATVIDPISIPGTGLISFGTFSFSADSAVPSVLVIPRVIIGRREGRGWITRIRFSDESPNNDMMPAVVALEKAANVMFSPGRQSEAGFRAAVDEAIARITKGEVSKVVMARDLVGQLSAEDDIRGTIAALAQSYPDCWTYAVDGLIGSSPETLVSVHDNRMDARVLAGTASRGVDAASDLESAAGLASSVKDLDEHGFAVRSVVEALTPFTSHLSISDGPFTLKLPNLWHLATDIGAALTQGSTSLDLVQALHPTAAVAGTPTRAAVALIAELEPFDRGRYAGPVGWIGANGDGEWAIALRSAQITGSTITAYAGCGIVAESVAETELNETLMKFRPIVDALS